MSGRRANVDRELYASALADASDWQTSILESHDGGLDSRHGYYPGCCKPGARCEQYKAEERLLARYAAARARLRNTATSQNRKD